MPRPLNLAHHVCAPQWRRRVRTLGEALALIDKELPKERRHAPHWRRARELLTRAIRSRDPSVIEGATAQLERALQEEAPDAAEPGDHGGNDHRT
jgi:hypothetical protein